LSGYGLVNKLAADVNLLNSDHIRMSMINMAICIGYKNLRDGIQGNHRGRQIL